MIKKKRLALKLSQRQLGGLIGVDQTYISKLELYRKEPSFTILKKLSEILDICMVDLLRQYLCSECKKDNCKYSDTL